MSRPTSKRTRIKNKLTELERAIEEQARAALELEQTCSELGAAVLAMHDVVESLQRQLALAELYIAQLQQARTTTSTPPSAEQVPT